jgi:transposase
VVTTSQRQPDGYSAADRFTVVLKTAWLNAAELNAYSR